MRFTILVLLVLTSLFAQKASNKQPAREQCGHDCHCLRRTQKIQNEHMEACDSKFDRKSKAWLDCFASQPQHCDIASDRTGKYPYPYLPCNSDDKNCGSAEPSHTGNEDTGTMDVRCTAKCAKHDCKCDDGPTCNDVP